LGIFFIETTVVVEQEKMASAISKTGPPVSSAAAMTFVQTNPCRCECEPNNGTARFRWQPTTTAAKQSRGAQHPFDRGYPDFLRESQR
jgi:hypothetical protein